MIGSTEMETGVVVPVLTRTVAIPVPIRSPPALVAFTTMVQLPTASKDFVTGAPVVASMKLPLFGPVPVME
jgi:hypothetical protein